MKLHSAFALSGMASLLRLNVAAARTYGCLEARMDSFVETGTAAYPDANGFVTVCFDGSLDSDTGGQLEMYVEGLNAGSITGAGVHIHAGKSGITDYHDIDSSTREKLDQPLPNSSLYSTRDVVCK